MKQKIHFTDSWLLNPTNPVSVNLIGAGRTGSQVLHLLGRMNYILMAHGHPGLFVRLFDGDTVTKANIATQLFFENEIGFNKAGVLINRANRQHGTNWKAFPYNYDKVNFHSNEKYFAANITISCVDTIAARFTIAEIISGLKETYKHYRDQLIYWMDFGNLKHTGQVILSTVGDIKQPNSRKYKPVAILPFITDEFKEQLYEQIPTEMKLPSCSLAQAVSQQDLFINPSVAIPGVNLLWQMFREGMTAFRGVFINLKTFRMQPIPVG